jgi:hypothetical protein
MLSKFTWSDYVAVVAILGGAYYLIIAIRYYRKEMTGILSGKLKFKQKISDGYTAPGELEEADFDELEAVVVDLKRSVLEQAGTSATKEQLLLQLKQRLANYDGLRQPAYRVAVNHYIMQHAQEICGVAFSEGELDAAWKTLPR